MRTAVHHVHGSGERRQRGAWRTYARGVAAALALSLGGCANVVIGPPVPPGQGAPPGPTLPAVHGPLGPDGAYNGGDELCRNFRAYHSDCRRRHGTDDSGAQHGADQPADATSSA